MPYVVPTTVSTGDVYQASAHNVIVNDVIDLRSYQNRIAKYTRTSGNVTLNSTSWANIDTAMDLTITASSGDVIEMGLSGLLGNQAVATSIDAVTVVSGSAVSSFASQGAAPTGSTGPYLPGTWGQQTVYVWMNTVMHLTLGSGDVSGGNVTLRLRYLTATATNRTLYGDTDNRFYWYGRNLGPITTA